jgi:hypothetical protein
MDKRICLLCDASVSPSLASQGIGSCVACSATLSTGCAVRVTSTPGASRDRRRPVPALSPRFLAQYRPTGVLGQGAMGTVIKAHRVSDDRCVAVKLLTPGADADLMDRFLKEALLLARLDHPHIVKVLDLGQDAEQPYLVSAFMNGGTLRSLLDAHGRVGVSRATSLIADCLAGLEFCHAHGIVHRDIKPENILLDAEGRALVADLGIAKHFGAAGPLTESGSLMGTPRYMSPEQLEGAPPSVASDLYATGTVLFELLAGSPPFSEDMLYALMRAKIEQEAPVLEPSTLGGHRELAQIVGRALARDPSARHASARQMRDELVALPTGTRGARARARSFARATTRVLALATGSVRMRWLAIGAAAVLVPALWWLSRASRPPDAPVQKPLAGPASALAPPSVARQPVAPPPAAAAALGAYTGHCSAGSAGSVPGMIVRFEREDRGLIRETVSDKTGQYSIRLPAGRYRVLATHPEFETYSSWPGFFVVTGEGRQIGDITVRKRGADPCPGGRRGGSAPDRYAAQSDQPPRVRLRVEPRNVQVGQSFTVAVDAEDDVGLDSVWWGCDQAVRQPFAGSIHGIEGAAGKKLASQSWTFACDVPGTYSFWGQARDVAYGLRRGEAHQASEGEGMPCATLIVAEAGPFAPRASAPTTPPSRGSTIFTLSDFTPNALQPDGPAPTTDAVGLRIQEPTRIAPNRLYSDAGVALEKPVPWDVEVEAVVDLAASRLGSGASISPDGTGIRLQVMAPEACGSAYAVSAEYIPNPRARGGGQLTLLGGGALRVPEGTRSLRMVVRRSKGRVSGFGALDAGELQPLGDCYVNEAKGRARPNTTTDIRLYVILYDRRNAFGDAHHRTDWKYVEFLPLGHDEYAVREIVVRALGD